MDDLDNPGRRSAARPSDNTSANSYGFAVASTLRLIEGGDRCVARIPTATARRRIIRDASGCVIYAARRRNGEPISTAFLESAVNEIIAKRMNKKQQMRWNRATVQPFLDVRTAVLNDTLEDAFRRRYPGFRPANGNEVVALTA
ncbi:MAG: hypothetical protein JWQ55_2415 [Rhodopila sp.]|nr:hypothetical protein [Rhodopila sp.]